MKTKLLQIWVLLCLLTSGLMPLRAQESEITTLNRALIEAWEKKNYDQALSILEQLHARQPRTPGNAYNSACLHALRGSLEPGLEWLERAVQWGFGGSRATLYVPGSSAPAPLWHAQMAAQDPDLSFLRQDPRFEALLARMRATQKRVEQVTAEPGYSVPKALENSKQAPVLVWLHAEGASKQLALEGWKQWASEQGFVLLVPAAPIPMGESESAGMRWIDDAVAFRASGGQAPALSPINQALSFLRKQGHELQPGSVYFAGESEGATLALLAAFAHASLARVALAQGGEFEASWVFAQSSNAQKHAVQFEWLLTQPTAAERVAAVEAQAKSVRDQCAAWGLSFQVRVEALTPKLAQAGWLRERLVASRAQSASLPPASK